eukprot:11617499-Alexandrium_andersonii.AAC.1
MCKDALPNAFPENSLGNDGWLPETFRERRAGGKSWRGFKSLPFRRVAIWIRHCWELKPRKYKGAN